MTGKRYGIYVLLALYALVGSVYSVVTPVMEASDELWHYPVVYHLAQGNGLPVQDPTAAQLWRQEGSTTRTGVSITAWWPERL